MRRPRERKNEAGWVVAEKCEQDLTAVQRRRIRCLAFDTRPPGPDFWGTLTWSMNLIA